MQHANNSRYTDSFKERNYLVPRKRTIEKISKEEFE